MFGGICDFAGTVVSVMLRTAQMLQVVVVGAFVPILQMGKLGLSLLVTYPQPQAESGGAGLEARGSCLVAAGRAPAHRFGLQVSIPERS